jgi:hypothetical protein
MKTLIQLIGYISIIVLILPSILYLSGKMELDQAKTIMLLATIVWFGANIILAWHLEEKLMGKNK